MVFPAVNPFAFESNVMLLSAASAPVCSFVKVNDRFDASIELTLLKI